MLAAVIAAIGAAGLWAYRHRETLTHPVAQSPTHEMSPAATAPRAATGSPFTPDRADAGNEGRLVDVAGRVHPAGNVRDPELGISVDALFLARRVEMLQWQEHCAGTRCDYALGWSSDVVDSGRFRNRRGHVNPARFPFSSARFAAESLRLGVFEVDPALVDDAALVAYPVKPVQLPPNLAATFREKDGVLYSGSISGQGAAGDLRVSYRVAPAGEKRFSAVQRGHRLLPMQSASSVPVKG